MSLEEMHKILGRVSEVVLKCPNFGKDYDFCNKNCTLYDFCDRVESVQSALGDGV